MVRCLLPLILICAAIPAQDAPVHRDSRRDYTLELLPGWRQLTPDEGRALRPKLPADLATRIVLTQLDRFGAIDAWQKDQFDGRCLTIAREDSEPEMTAATLDEVRSIVAARNQDSPFQIEIVELKLAELGETKIPVIASTIRLTQNGKPFAEALEFLIPTGGRTLRLSYRASPADFAAAEPLFRRSAASLVLRRPAQGPKDLADKLEMPLIIGGVVGLILLVLYKTRRS